MWWWSLCLPRGLTYVGRSGKGCCKRIMKLLNEFLVLETKFPNILNLGQRNIQWCFLKPCNGILLYV